MTTKQAVVTGTVPVASAVPARMIAHPISIVCVTVSPRKIPPHSIAKAGMR